MPTKQAQVPTKPQVGNSHLLSSDMEDGGVGSSTNQSANEAAIKLSSLTESTFLELELLNEKLKKEIIKPYDPILGF